MAEDTAVWEMSQSNQVGLQDRGQLSSVIAILWLLGLIVRYSCFLAVFRQADY